MHIRYLLALLPLVLLAGVAPNEQNNGSTFLHLLVRGTDTAPLKQTRITVIYVVNVPGAVAKPDSQNALTDDHGLARLVVPAGELDLTVLVDGMGYAIVGGIQGTANQEVAPDLPPLVPFGSISGHLNSTAMKSSIKVLASHLNVGEDQKHAPVAVDVNGSFHLTGLIAGKWWIWAEDKEGRQTAAYRDAIEVAPAEDIKGIELEPVKHSSSQETTSSAERMGPLPGEGQTVVWACGKITDEKGQPLSGVDVYALAVFHGGIRMYEETSHCTSDAAGEYKLQGPGGQRMFSATILAHVAGRPPVWDWPPSPPQIARMIPADSHPKAPPPLAPPIENLVIPARGGDLDVTVLQHGKPAVGAFVAVYLESVNLRDQWAAGYGPDHNAMVEAAYPMCASGDDGIAHFSNLQPGRYDVLVSTDRRQARAMRDDPFTPQMSRSSTISCAMGRGIPVVLDRTAKWSAEIYPQLNRVSFRLLDPQGAPLAGDPGFSYGPSETVEWNSGIHVEASGLASYEFGAPGLWRIQTSYRTLPVHSIPLQPPYFGCIQSLPISALLEGGYIPSFTARPILAPSAVVKIIDANGKPLRAPVVIERGGMVYGCGSTDANGEVVFTGLREGFDYVARAAVPGFEPVSLGYEGQPLPSIARLRNRTEIAAASFVATLDHRVSIVLSPRQVAYIYGKIQPPAGLKGKMEIYATPSTAESGTRGRITDDGEYIIGPFPPGTGGIGVWWPTKMTGDNRATFSTILQPGEAKELNITLVAGASSELTRPGQMLIGVNGASSPSEGAEQLKCQVLRPDGKTPALGARVYYLVPEQASPTIDGLTDALGTLHPHGRWQSRNAVPAGTVLGPSSPELVALLPGETGVVVVTPPQKKDEVVRIVLPKPISLSGDVAVDGMPNVSRKGTIHIMAAYQNHDALAPYMSVETTTDADGHFILAGLTIGNYKVQAALDDIWLSPSVDVHVGEMNPEPLRLTIASPSAPLIVHLKDSSGKPAIGISMTLDLPTGPLAETLWPRDWISDGAGQVYIPTLLAGQNTLHITSGGAAIRVKMPALPATRPVEISAEVPAKAAD